MRKYKRRKKIKNRNESDRFKINLQIKNIEKIFGNSSNIVWSIEYVLNI